MTRSCILRSRWPAATTARRASDAKSDCGMELRPWLYRSSGLSSWRDRRFERNGNVADSPSQSAPTQTSSVSLCKTSRVKEWGRGWRESSTRCEREPLRKSGSTLNSSCRARRVSTEGSLPSALLNAWWESLGFLADRSIRYSIWWIEYSPKCACHWHSDPGLFQHRFVTSDHFFNIFSKVFQEVFLSSRMSWLSSSSYIAMLRLTIQNNLKFNAKLAVKCLMSFRRL